MILRVIGAMMAVALAGAAPAYAQDRDLESAVKATFLIRFASFVQWPAESFPGANDPVVVCVIGDPAFGQLVETAARGEHIGVREIAVRRLPELAGDAHCHVVFAGEAQAVARVLDAARGQPVLTVTDERRTRARGMIHFVMDGGRVRFHIDRTAMTRARLNASSRLLNVALTVRSGGSR